MSIVYKIKSQSGRSITEVLGVLALIGVLSLGALSGYTWAMNRYRSNVLEDEIMQRSADIKMQLDRRRTQIHLHKWDTLSQVGYPIYLEEGTTGIVVENVKKQICQMTFDDLIGLAPASINAIIVNKTEYTSAHNNVCNDDKNNTMIFYFFADKYNAGGIGKCVPECSPPFVCERNKCVCPRGTPIGADLTTCTCGVEQVEEDGHCVCLGGKHPYNNTCVDCVAEEDCANNYTCENHICSCIPQECPNTDFTETLCACCPTDRPQWVEDDGLCKACAVIDVTKPIYNTATKECEACHRKNRRGTASHALAVPKMQP